MSEINNSYLMENMFKDLIQSFELSDGDLRQLIKNKYSNVYIDNRALFLMECLNYDLTDLKYADHRFNKNVRSRIVDLCTELIQYLGTDLNK